MREPAGRDGSAPLGPPRSPRLGGRVRARAEALSRLPWLAPAAESLATLARPRPSLSWPRLRHDPGVLLLVARQAAACWGESSASSCSLPALLEEPSLLEDALAFLNNQPQGFVDWSAPAAHTVYNACLAYAQRAEHLAGQIEACDPQAAWMGGFLAPLGCLALCALDPAAVAECLADPQLSHASVDVQQRRWGIDCAAVGRRLARRWRLPAWLAALAGDLSMSADLAIRRGANPVLFRVVRLAIVESPSTGLHLVASPTTAVEDRQALGLPPQDEATSLCRPEAIDNQAWVDPSSAPLLRDLMGAAAENRRLRNQPLHARLEREVDELHQALDEQVHGEARRTQTARLEALAELAAGAGHEINNPLAVISGHAQYLMARAGEWPGPEQASAWAKALEAIIGQTRRIHNVLRDLITFARPSPACRSCFDVPSLLGEVSVALGDLAAQRRVRVEVAARPERQDAFADASQVRQALLCLLRNAIEAAPADGWARLSVRQGPGPASVEIMVEDSGPGPRAEQRPALFDPFFSGRSAGRGRGMGLPIAWRLARQQGGDVRLEPQRPGAPTCFVLTLPCAPPEGQCSDGPVSLHGPTPSPTSRLAG